MRIGVGVAMGKNGSAIVTVHHYRISPPAPGVRPGHDARATSLEQLAPDLDAVAARLEAMAAEPVAPDDRPRVIVDAQGSGRALYETISEERRMEQVPGEPRYAGRQPLLYEGRGYDRQALSDALQRHVQLARVHFDLPPDASRAMGRAMSGYRRDVAEDGLVGSEIVVALALALLWPTGTPEAVGRDGKTYHSAAVAAQFGTSVWWT